MLLTAGEFAAGAQQLAAAWQARLPGEQPWQWVPSQAPFAASAGGGYLARQHTLAPAQPLAAGAAGQQHACSDGPTIRPTKCLCFTWRRRAETGRRLQCQRS
ncbi:non-ribosomal peptide synthetase [Chlorella sorokiniana]|uniref:Non-ribosomal peptide synthetase n=1 Tax=Chlorella sorokiniana TaxID=3076 RepID=A0A2P6TJE4_CHLSO|nr:non-ribosomal peptide synthetase [Chlorella sorokiniana]|eukprot:PRW39332.1 non-ribosomal peptide synthetase [Chlorella sorokiniana]